VSCVLATARLDLVPATAERLRAELRSPSALAEALGARVPSEWPPELYDRAAAQWWLAAYERDEEPGCWGQYYFVLRRPEGARVAVGVGGFKGAPREGTLEIGYSVLAPWQRQGIASEAVGGLLSLAFATPCVARVVAETLAEGVASIAVLRRHGFAPGGAGSEPGVLRFARERPA
jgi:ribosomal-protein-alanine N-acetyltransferase